MRKFTFVVMSILFIFCKLPLAFSADKVVVIPLGSSSNSIIGSWWMKETPQYDDIAVLTFLDSTHYFCGQYGDSSSEPIGTEDGMEHGTYTWNPQTGAYTAYFVRDDNGEWCLTDNDVGDGPESGIITVQGNTLTITDKHGSAELYRVTE